MPTENAASLQAELATRKMEASGMLLSPAKGEEAAPAPRLVQGSGFRVQGSGFRVLRIVSSGWCLVGSEGMNDGALCIPLKRLSKALLPAPY